MFPIVPFHYNTRNSILINSGCNHLNQSSKSSGSARVVAGTNLPQGAKSGIIEAGELLGEPSQEQISVEADTFGLLSPAEDFKHSKTPHWIRSIRLSDDCNSYNIQLRFQPSRKLKTNLYKHLPTPKLILQTVRPINAGEELLLWFSEEILGLLQIAFLTPPNIQGQKQYVCIKCSALFESPNPLKLHITLVCDEYPISTLWTKLSNIVNENALALNIKEEIFDFKLSPPHKQYNAIDLSLSSSEIKKSESPANDLLYKPYLETSSAFKPFKREISDSETKPNFWPMLPLQNDFQMLQLNNGNTSNYPQDESHIESLVSSLGRSKEGHICLYCGKCYSRKYGLKIHIRTHTGYKPLKCKFCMRPFGDPSNLNKHVRLHAEGNTPYKCELCGKVLVRRRDLDRHLKSRHMIEMHPGSNIISENSNSDQGDTQMCSSDI